MGGNNRQHVAPPVTRERGGVFFKLRELLACFRNDGRIVHLAEGGKKRGSQQRHVLIFAGFCGPARACIEGIENRLREAAECVLSRQATIKPVETGKAVRKRQKHKWLHLRRGLPGEGEKIAERCIAGIAECRAVVQKAELVFWRKAGEMIGKSCEEGRRVKCAEITGLSGVDDRYGILRHRDGLRYGARNDAAPDFAGAERVLDHRHVP